MFRREEISDQRTSQTGPKIHARGVKDGLIRDEYQPGIASVVKNEPDVEDDKLPPSVLFHSKRKVQAPAKALGLTYFHLPFLLSV